MAESCENGAVNPTHFVISGTAAAGMKLVGRRSRVTNTCPFIRGPIDLNWLAKAREHGVSALWLGLGLWYLRGLRKADSFLVSNVMFKAWGLKPDAKSRALRALEGAGLIRVERRGKRSPHVTILSSLIG